MGAKEKLVGIILVIVGVFPLLMNITSVSDSLKQYTFISYVMGGQPVYQIIIIILGGLLLYTPRPRSPYPYPPRR